MSVGIMDQIIVRRSLGLTHFKLLFVCSQVTLDAMVQCYNPFVLVLIKTKDTGFFAEDIQVNSKYPSF